MLKHALENVKVIDLSSYIAGSFCPALLADLGADVIKLESPMGDPFRSNGGPFQVWNRGKRGLVVNLRKVEGQQILYKLVKDADVVVENYRPGVAAKLGAGYETLKKINPTVIYCSISGYGQTGPYSKKPGFDPLLQARSGAMTYQGGPGNPPVFLAVAISDYAGAMLGAWGISMALFTRARTGQGQWVQTSLVNATMAIQSGRFIIPSGETNGNDPGHPQGPTPTYRAYKTTDGWFFVGAITDEHWRSLANALGSDDLSQDNRFDTKEKRLKADPELHTILAEIFAGNSSDHWLRLLEAEDVPCSKVNYFNDDLMYHPQVLHNELVVEHHSKDIGDFKQIGVPVKLSKTPGIAQRAAPGHGEHSDEILLGAGYSSEEIKTFREAKVIY